MKLENKNSRYEIRKYYVTYTDDIKEAHAIISGEKIDAKWQEQFELWDWQDDEQ